MRASATSPRFIATMDPGKITGLGLLDLQTGSAEFSEHDEDGVYRTLWGWCAQHQHAGLQLVSERFRINANTHKKSTANWSLELIGSMKLLAFMYGLPPVILQLVSDAKTFAPDPKLKLVGWHTPTKGNHANDAARHMMLYCSSRRLHFTQEDYQRMAAL